MHKKGITEEVAKKRSRKNVKVQVSGGNLVFVAGFERLGGYPAPEAPVPPNITSMWCGLEVEPAQSQVCADKSSFIARCRRC
jgi:hypothetical protein